MAWTGFKSKGFVSNTAGMDYLEQANTDQAQAHRNAMANRAKQEEHAARETAKQQAREGRREANRAEAKERRASRAKAREKSDRVARYLDASLDEGQVSETVSPPATTVFDPTREFNPTINLTDPQGAALASLGTDRTALEAGGASIGAQTDNLIAKIEEDETDAGGYFSAYLDKIVMPTSTFEGRNLDQVTRHELLHRLVEQLMSSGVLAKIELPEMQSILQKFDTEFTGTATVADFINFVQMNHPSRYQFSQSDIIPSTGDYANRVYRGERFDPRMRSAGWDWSGQGDYIGQRSWGGDDLFINEQGWEGVDSFNYLDPSYGAYRAFDPDNAPWTGSGTKWELDKDRKPISTPGKGQKDYEDWIAFQRELPSEKYGGARVRGEGTPKYSFDPRDQFDEAQISGWNTETLPWGPATVNHQWVREGFTDSQGNPDYRWKRIPKSTGTPDPIPLGFKDSLFKPEMDPTDYGSETGLGNWPMGDEHALLAAQAARFDLPGQQDYVGPGGKSSGYYGRLARFNRAAALKAHPDSRIRQLAEAEIPDIVLDKITEVLSSGGHEVWGQLGSYENAMNYLNQLMKQYQAGMVPQQESKMPKVGKRKFAYTPKGKVAAKRYAKKTGKKVKKVPGY